MAEEKTIGRKELALAVRRDVSKPSREQAQAIVDLLLDEIVGGLMSDQKVHLEGFGVFYLRLRFKKQGRKTKPDDENSVAATRVVSFKPSKSLVEAANQKPSRKSLRARMSGNGLSGAS